MLSFFQLYVNGNVKMEDVVSRKINALARMDIGEMFANMVRNIECYFCFIIPGLSYVNSFS